MAVTSYLALEGEVLSETRGGVRRDYVPDALGSTAALLDSSQAVTDSWAYRPYGEIASRTGTTSTPFAFVGTLGYYREAAAEACYVRARYLRTSLGRWQSVDPLWPAEQSFGYADQAPVVWTDPSGRAPGCQQAPPQNPCSKDGTLPGAVIALLCSFGTVKDIVTDMKDGMGIPKGEWKKLKDYLGKLNGKQYSPEDCCKSAHGNPRGPA